MMGDGASHVAYVQVGKMHPDSFRITVLFPAFLVSAHEASDATPTRR